MNYREFFRFLKKWREFKKLPPATGWPRTIKLDTKAWDGIEKLYTLTKMDNYEYETSFFYVEGETFITTPLRGTRDQVTANHSLQVKYEVDQKRKLFYRNVILDNNVVSKTAVKPNKLPKNADIGFLFNVHSHPVHINETGQTTYSFFSDTDIRTLLASQATVSGLVTDKFWLVVKTDQVISQVGEVGESLLRDISHRSFAGEQELDDIIREKMQRWGLVFYRSNFRGELEKIN